MRILIITAILTVLCSMGMAQSLSELQKKKEDAVREIEYTTRLLEEIQKSERTSLNRLRLINNKIKQRNTLISSLQEEMDLYQEFIDNNAMVIQLLNSDLDQIKNEYAELIRSAYRNKNVNDKILFLLSADNVNQAYKRFLYLKRYSEYRKDQANLITEIQAVLNKKIIQLEEQKLTRQDLVDETLKETRQLTEEKDLHNTEYWRLKYQERNLLKKKEDQLNIELALEKAIQRIINETAGGNPEIPGTDFGLSNGQKLVGDSFAQNKKRLPWPVERGIITEGFGVHQHPVLVNIQVQNNGINITTEVGARVRAIFDGEVSRVFGISGGNTAVIIRHGNYLTVYSNLQEVQVQQGDQVSAKQDIGTVYYDQNDENKSTLKFQIWHETQKLDP